MRNTYQALLCAQFVIAFFTLDTTGLTRVDQHGYHPVNNTLPNQKQWNQQQQQPYAQQNTATTHNPNQGWSNRQMAGNGNINNNANTNTANQWNRYNQTGYGVYNGYQSPSMANQWQRYNNTPSQPGTYNPGLPGWSPHQQQQSHLLNNSTNWQRSGQSNLYPQLPQPNPSWTGLRPQAIVPTTPSSFGSNRWNNNNNTNVGAGRWNNTFIPPQQYPGISGGGSIGTQNNWSNGQNRTSWGSAVPTAQPVGTNVWNRPNATNNNNYGWGGNPTSVGQNSWNAGGQNNWRNTPSNPGSSSDNNWSSNGAQNGYNTNNNNNNWPNSQGSQGSQTNSGGTPLAPIGQPGSIPLPPISGGSNMANSWNAGSNSSPQLAPLAPLTYVGGGGGGGNNPYDTSKKGNANPYAGMFN